MIENMPEGYFLIGRVSVDSASLIVGDPGYLLHHGGTENQSSKPTCEEVWDVIAQDRAGEVRNELAVVFRSGYGDGTYNVYGRLNDHGRIVQVVIDMGMTDFQTSLFERDFTERRETPK
jgi:uncharacterized protein DUF4241